jgi:hypothetical protein
MAVDVVAQGGLKDIFSGNGSLSRLEDIQRSYSSQEATLTEWPESEAHLALLAHFLKARSADCYLENWAGALEEPPREVVARFIRKGLLESLPLIDNVVGCNSVAHLKKLLKERGLKVTGKKRELAERLVAHNETEMETLHHGRAILTCSARVRELASQYLAEKAKDHDDTIAAALAALRMGDFAIASQTIAAYRGRQLKLHAPNPLAIEGPPRSTSADIEALKVIFGLKPDILGPLSASDWDAIHAIAGVNHLLDGALSADWLTRELEGRSKLSEEAVLRMMRFALLHHRDLGRLRQIGVKQATFICVKGGSCEACLTMADKVFPLEAFPALPYKKCTCDIGCRCSMRAVMPWL